jgi:hypothetical protein
VQKKQRSAPIIDMMKAKMLTTKKTRSSGMDAR